MCHLLSAYHLHIAQSKNWQLLPSPVPVLTPSSKKVSIFAHHLNELVLKNKIYTTLRGSTFTLINILIGNDGDNFDRF